ncbi:MAG: hypothetical protein ACYS4W_09920 [Planctomycetota bacterium]|jgi:hypothetical protein
MIKTLRITSIIAVILAAGLFVFLVIFGFRGDEAIEKYLSSPGAVEKFKQTKGQSARKGKNQVFPLVKQAQAFGLYLNPPPPSAPTKRGGRPSPSREGPRDIPRPPTSSAKFTVVATSFQQSAPELSLALIDDPGKGRYWVRQSNVVNHLTIEEIKDGIVIVRGSKGTIEIPVEQREPRRSLLAGSAPVSAAPPQTGPVGTAASPSAAASAAAQRGKGGRADMTPEEIREAEALAEKIFAQMEAGGDVSFEGFDVGKSGDQDNLPSEEGPDVASMRITGAEAKTLDRLGRELDSVRRDTGQDPNGAAADTDPKVVSTRRRDPAARKKRSDDRRARMIKERIKRAKALAERNRAKQAQSSESDGATEDAE